MLPDPWYSSILPQKCMKFTDSKSQRKFRYFRWCSCNLFNCYKQINGKNLFLYIFEPESSFHHVFPTESIGINILDTIHTRNIIFHIVMNKFHEQIQWTGAAGYIKFLFFSAWSSISSAKMMLGLCLPSCYNQGYLHLLLTILINKCIKRPLFGRKN